VWQPLNLGRRQGQCCVGPSMFCLTEAEWDDRMEPCPVRRPCG
jgi:hypothetical protein